MAEKKTKAEVTGVTEVAQATAQVANNNVVAADQKVAQIIAERAAKKQEKHNKIMAKHPKIGKILCVCDDYKWHALAFALTAGVSAGVTVATLKHKDDNDPDVQAGIKLLEDAKAAGITSEEILSGQAEIIWEEPSDDNNDAEAEKEAPFDGAASEDNG